MAKQLWKPINEASIITHLSVAGIKGAIDEYGLLMKEKADGIYVDLIDLQWMIKLEGLSAMEHLAR